MKRRRSFQGFPYLLLGILALALSACQEGETATPAAPVEDHVAIVKAYVDAYNGDDAAAMSALMHPDIEWLSISGSRVELVSAGREKLTEEMRVFFQGESTATSTLSGIGQTGGFVSTIETASWMGDDNKDKSQSSLAVYEVTADGLIRRIWYYPEVASDD